MNERPKIASPPPLRPPVQGRGKSRMSIIEFITTGPKWAWIVAVILTVVPGVMYIGGMVLFSVLAMMAPDAEEGTSKKVTYHGDSFFAIDPPEVEPSPEFMEGWGSDTDGTLDFIKGVESGDYELSKNQRLWVTREVTPRFKQIAMRLSQNGKIPIEDYEDEFARLVDKHIEEIYVEMDRIK